MYQCATKHDFSSKRWHEKSIFMEFQIKKEGTKNQRLALQIIVILEQKWDGSLM